MTDHASPEALPILDMWRQGNSVFVEINVPRNIDARHHGRQSMSWYAYEALSASTGRPLPASWRTSDGIIVFVHATNGPSIHMLRNRYPDNGRWLDGIRPSSAIVYTDKLKRRLVDY